METWNLQRDESFLGASDYCCRSQLLESDAKGNPDSQDTRRDGKPTE